MFGGLEISVAELVACCLAAGAGAAVQGVIGFGYALLVVPALLFVAPEAVPVTPLVVAMPMVVVLALAERGGLDRAGFVRLTAGRIPGTALGAWVVTLLADRVLAGTVGALLVCAVLGSLARGRGEVSPTLEVAAGFGSGVAGTVGAVGGPYMGLAFADRPGPVLRGTLSLAFVVGTVMSLAAVAAAGVVDRDAVGLGLVLVPATLLGLLAGRRLTGRIDGPRLRPLVLSVAGASGTFGLVRALVG